MEGSPFELLSDRTTKYYVCTNIRYLGNIQVDYRDRGVQVQAQIREHDFSWARKTRV